MGDSWLLILDLTIITINTRGLRAVGQSTGCEKPR